MTDAPQVLRLSKVAKEFNIGLQTIVDFLSRKGHQIELNPNTKITGEMYDMLVKEFQAEKSVKEESRRLGLTFTKKETITIEDSMPVVEEKEKETEELLIKDTKSVAAGKKEIFRVEQEDVEIKAPKIIGKIDSEKLNPKPKATKEKEEEKEEKVQQKKETFEKPKSKKGKEEKESQPEVEIKEKKSSKKEAEEATKKVESKTEEIISEEKVEEKQEKPIKPEKKEEPVKEVIVPEEKAEPDSKIKVIGKIDLDSMNTKTKPDKKTKAEKEAEKKAKQNTEKKTLIKKEPEPVVVKEEKESGNASRLL